MEITSFRFKVGLPGCVLSLPLATTENENFYKARRWHINNTRFADDISMKLHNSVYLILVL